MSKHLTIVIPALNEAQVIEDTLRPLQPLRKRGVELVLSDGGSSDSTVELAQRWVDQVWLSDRGRSRQMNSGAMVASGEYLLFLHADTLLPQAFKSLWPEILLDQPEWGFFSVKLSGRQWLLRVVERMMNWRSRRSGLGTGDQALFVRRSTFEQMGGFADIPLMEDLEICSRLKSIAAPRVVSAPVVTSSRRWEAYGICRTIVKMWRLRAAYAMGANPVDLARRYTVEGERGDA